jgi:hypothetical protein
MKGEAMPARIVPPSDWRGAVKMWRQLWIDASDAPEFERIYGEGWQVGQPLKLVYGRRAVLCVRQP